MSFQPNEEIYLVDNHQTGFVWSNINEKNTVVLEA